MVTYLDLQDATGTPIRFHGSGAPNRGLTGAQGLPAVFGFAGARDSSYNKPSYHGSVTRSRWQKPALLTLEGFVRGTTPDAAIAELDALKIPLLDALDTGRLLTYQRGTDGTGVQLQAVARLTDDLDVKDEAGGRVLRYQAHLRLDDPRAYTQTLTTAVGAPLGSGGGATLPRTLPVTFLPGANGTVAVTNTGTRPSPPVFRIYGLATSAQIVHVDSGARIVITGTIASGNYLEVDVAARTLKLNGTSPAQGMLDSASTTWFELPRGSSTIRLIAATNDAITRVDVLYRGAYS